MLQPHAAFAHIPPGSFIIAKVADKRAALSLNGEIDLTLQTEKPNGEQADERLYLESAAASCAGLCMTTNRSRSSATTSAPKSPAVGNRARRSRSSLSHSSTFLLPARVERRERQDRAGSRCASTSASTCRSIRSGAWERGSLTCIGAKPGEKDRPQIWIDKEWFEPIRVVYKDTYHGKTGVWDLQWREWNSREAGDNVPHLIERRFDGQLVSRSEVYQKATPNARLSESLFALPR